MRFEVHVTSDQVKAEAARRIALMEWRIERAIDRQDAEDERKWRSVRDALRRCSDALETISPIPHDFANDKWWTS